MHENNSSEIAVADQHSTDVGGWMLDDGNGETFTARERRKEQGDPYPDNRERILRRLELYAVVRDPVTNALVGADIRISSGGVARSETIPADLATKRQAAADWQRRTGFGFSARDARIASEWLADALSVAGARVRHQVSRPGWVGNRLHRTEAFMASSVPEENARRWWTEAVRHIVENQDQLGKLAALVGASAISPQLERLKIDPFVAHAYGGTTTGKTSAAIVATSVWGNPRPDALRKPWNNTIADIVATLRDHHVLPVFLDESGDITDPRPERVISSVVMNASGGRERGRLNQDGSRREAETWSLVLVSTGEQRLTGYRGLTGIAARVVEIAAPLMPDAETADRFKRGADAFHGWIGYWLSEDEWLPPTLPSLTASTPVARRIRPAVAAAVAGFSEICRVLDVEGFDATAVGQAILDEIADNLQEIGETPGQRLLAAIQYDFVNRTESYPEPMLGGAFDELMVRDRRGVRRDGKLYVFAETAQKLADETGVDLRAAMRELADDNMVLRGGGRNLTRKSPKIAGARVNAYVLKWTDSDVSPDTEPVELDVETSS